MKGITFFSGGGLADIGYEEAGIEHVLCVDFNEDAVASAKAAGFPSVCCGVEDTATWLPLVADEPGPFFVHASPPCQPYSTAGSRKAQHDERDGFPMLWTALDALGGRVRWLVIEQVPGLLQHNGACKDRCTGRCPRSYFDNEVLTELRRRFDWVDYRVLNSSSFGVPQHRRRVVVVAGPGPIVWPEPTHGDPATLNQGSLFGPRLKPWVSFGEALGLTSSQGMAERNGGGRRGWAPVDTAAPCPTVVAGSHRDNGLRILGGGTNPRAPGEGDKRTLRDITDEPSTTITRRQPEHRGQPEPGATVARVRAVAVGGGQGQPVPEPAERIPDALGGGPEASDHATFGARVGPSFRR
jgi:DNA (cytosine-5)-methyltransferase 1